MGRLPHPCEQVCKRVVLVDEPMAIRGIKRYLDENVEYTRPKYPRLYDERIAVIGAGPAGLSAGHFLSELGYEVDIYEANNEPGGMLVRAIPDFRLSHEEVRKDIKKLEEAGLTIHCSAPLGKKQIAELQKEYDAIVAIGQYADPIFPEADGETVFWAGDIAGGACSVIDALASGRDAAFDVDAAIQERMLRNGRIGHKLVPGPLEEKLYPCNRRKTRRHERPMQPAAERVKNFDDVEITYTAKQVYQEELRCLGCGYAMIDAEKCIGCGVCQKLCPEGDVITMVRK
ncbi:MAG: NAD(P)-binding protein [Lachnospiraceae bacterium]|nr:NAD(P)-binding protein [Lachnospiraceae bacterium]